MKKKSQLLLKVTRIWIPFFSISVLLTFIYTALHWFLLKKDKFSFLDERLFNIVFPGIIAIGGVYLLIKPKLKLLYINNYEEPDHFYRYTAAIVVIGITMIMAQEYMRLSTGQITNLKTTEEITEKPKSKFYTIEDFNIDPKDAAAYISQRGAGRYSGGINLDLYFTYPLCKDNLRIWYGLKFNKQISDDLTERDRKAAIDAFYETCVDSLLRFDFASFCYLDRIDYNRDYRGYRAAIQYRYPNFASDSPIILTPHFIPFESRTGNRLEWLGATFVAGNIIWLLLLVRPELRIRVKSASQQTRTTEISTLAMFFVPREGYIVTPFLIGMNILVYTIMIFSGVDLMSPQAIELIPWGANLRPSVMEGEWWRLVVCIFLHAGLLHLIFNLYALVMVGIELEGLLGSIRFFFAYIVAGISGSIASIYWHEVTVSVGASGAILGLFGAFIALFTTNIVPKGDRTQMLTSIGIFIVYNLLAGLKGNIDNVAHVGGLIAGFIMGYILYFTINEKTVERETV